MIRLTHVKNFDSGVVVERRSTDGKVVVSLGCESTDPKMVRQWAKDLEEAAAIMEEPKPETSTTEPPT